MSGIVQLVLGENEELTPEQVQSEVKTYWVVGVWEDGSPATIFKVHSYGDMDDEAVVRHVKFQYGSDIGDRFSVVNPPLTMVVESPHEDLPPGSQLPP